MTDALLIRIVASRGERDGMLGDEIVANLRLSPAAIGDDKGREAFLGLVLEGADEVYAAMRERRWLP